MQYSSGGEQMRMDAELLAIGKFSKGIVNYLDYPKDFYDDTPEGAIIITRVVDCVTTTASEDLADAFRINPWKFEQHCELDAINADLFLMQEAAEDPLSVEVFKALRDAGFKFYYLPNG